ncbi:MAG: hypothetical protein M3340_11460 [Actinomycetota bacterium]|nr:hypothetical protein [Actinomycetota bacterium]
MKLDLRFVLPAALASVALALPAGTAVGDPPEDHNACPNTTDWLLVPAALAPRDKDTNEDGFVCQKIDPDEPVKDNNNPPDDDDFIDNIYPG